MNLQDLFALQKKLDERIVKEKGLEGKDLLPEKVLALQVELGELANEWRGFKFWSENQKANLYKEEINLENDRFRSFNPMLEEYVDCLHFALSIGLEVNDANYDMDDYEFYIKDQEEVGLTELFIVTNWIAGCLIENQIHYEQMLLSVLELGQSLGFAWEQIEQAYYEKNQINHERQANGY